jgi:hypothetical protein
MTDIVLEKREIISGGNNNRERERERDRERERESHKKKKKKVKRHFCYEHDWNVNY